MKKILLFPLFAGCLALSATSGPWVFPYGVINSGGGSDTTIIDTSGAGELISDSLIAHGLGADSSARFKTVGVKNSANSSAGAYYDFRKDRAGANVQNGDTLGGIRPQGISNSVFLNMAPILARVNGTFTNGQRPPTSWCIYANAANTTDVCTGTFASDGVTFPLPVVASSTLGVTGNTDLGADLDVAGSAYVAGFSGVAAATSPTQSGTQFEVSGSTSEGIIGVSGFGSSDGGALRFYYAGGSRSSPTPAQTGKLIGAINAGILDSSATNRTTAFIRLRTDGAQGNASRASAVSIGATDYNSTTLQDYFQIFRGGSMFGAGLVSPINLYRRADTSLVCHNCWYNSDGGGYKIGLNTSGSKWAAADFFNITNGKWSRAHSTAAGAANTAVTFVDVMKTSENGVKISPWVQGFSNTSTTIDTSSQYVYTTTTAFTAPRTLTLLAPSVYGARIVCREIKDEGFAINGANVLIIDPGAVPLDNSATPDTLTVAGSSVKICSNPTSNRHSVMYKWTP